MMQVEAGKESGRPRQPLARSVSGEDGGGGGLSGPWRALAPRLVAWVAVLVFVALVRPDPSLSLLLLALVGIITIVSESRFGFERRLEAAGLPSREAWVPLVLLLVMPLYGLIGLDNVTHVLTDKGPVIVFILAFALVAEGLRRSGFFSYLAYRLSGRGGGDTTRLTLYLFLLSSLLTYFTSNDIVILIMTPIVVSVAYQARIANAKLLLLSQFVAGNTVSMGILIGSPTNLILGRALDIGFLEYLFLMLVPSAMALMATFVFVTWANRFVERRSRRSGRVTRWLVDTWVFSPAYVPPRFSEYQVFTRQMGRWVAVFGGAVLILAVSTSVGEGLLAVGLVISAVSLVLLRWEEVRGNGNGEQTSAPGGLFIARAFKVLPLGIVFFGLTYFVVADAVAEAPFVRERVDTFVTDQASSHTPVVSWSAILSSGVLVNTMNDLPASAVAGEILPRVDYETSFDRALVVQGVLVGLNIATYVTPVGALAGIIWFDSLRRERQRRQPPVAEVAVSGDGRSPAKPSQDFDVEMPVRRDLVIYGTTMFLAVTAVLGITNFGTMALIDLLLGPVSGGTAFGSQPGHAVWTVACMAVAAVVVVAFRRALASAGVVLAHLGDLLVVMKRLRAWGRRRSIITGVLVVAAAGAVSGFTLYWSERFHARTYQERAPFDGLADFAAWPVELVSSGFEDARLPNSVLGYVLPVATAAGVLVRLAFLTGRAARSRRLDAAED